MRLSKAENVIGCGRDCWPIRNHLGLLTNESDGVGIGCRGAWRCAEGHREQCIGATEGHAEGHRGMEGCKGVQKR